MARMTIREWQAAFNNGEFEDGSFSNQVKAGWYDWFCADTSLKNKTKKLGRIVSKLENSKRVNLDTMYVWFKNNCPCTGPLYDDFRIADIETGDVQYTITVDCGLYKTKYTVWGVDNNFNGEIIGFNDLRDLVKWLNE